jgi:hypothetical protein
LRLARAKFTLLAGLLSRSVWMRAGVVVARLCLHAAALGEPHSRLLLLRLTPSTTTTTAAAIATTGPAIRAHARLQTVHWLCAKAPILDLTGLARGRATCCPTWRTRIRWPSTGLRSSRWVVLVLGICLHLFLQCSGRLLSFCRFLIVRSLLVDLLSLSGSCFHASLAH